MTNNHDHAATDNSHHPSAAQVVSDLTAQMQRLELARQRIHASSKALIDGTLVFTPSPVQADQRVADMGRAMDHVLQGMQNQALADINGILGQHAALRQFQQRMAREQQAPASSGVHGTATSIHPKNSDVIDVEAKPISPQK